MAAFWKSLSKRARMGLVAGTLGVILITSLGGYWLLRTDFQVLFADLKPQDAAAMTAELERQKIPYRLSEHGSAGGTSILVDKAEVHKTRIKLMGGDIPLHGTVGFEVFNNSDFGMTEFAQKINYQRALQGELTRTILSLTEVRDARVLLALPEQGLFKQANAKSKASITLTMKHGQTLRGDQVSGIQRLVAAAVPGISAEDVTIVDQSGVALTRAAGEGDGGTSGRLDLKREMENYLARKASEVLERTLGPGQALASVDVTLDMQRVQTTTEDIVAASPGRGGEAPTGVVVRQRETLREVGAPVSARSEGDSQGSGMGGTSQREVEYAVGRRVEQVISQPGSVRRIQVVAVVKKVLDVAQQEQLRKTVAASVGAVFDRGDAVVVQSMGSVAVAGREQDGQRVVGSTGDGASDWVAGSGGARGQQKGDARKQATSSLGDLQVVAMAIGAVMLLVTVGFCIRPLLRGPSARRSSVTSPTGELSESQRAAVLTQVQAWMRNGTGGAARGEVR